jgi:1,2-diacylglycerol-3-alpha-glucose alpha-1,2-galactosyltransferase
MMSIPMNHHRLTVNVVSESAFTVQGHGVHSAFLDTMRVLREHTDFVVKSNSSTPTDVIHIHTIGPYSLAKLLFGKGAKVVSAHVTPDSFVGSLVGAKYWYGLAKAYLAWFYGRAEAVLAVSKEVEIELKRMGVTKPIYVVPNTIDVQEFRSSPQVKAAIRKKLGISPDKFVVVGCGQVQPRKRVDIYIDLAKRLPDIQFIWLGGMPFKLAAADSGHMKHIMRAENHPSNMLFTGMVDRKVVADYYRASDMFFLPSVQETFGIVIVEAAAAGLPLLLRDLPQYSDTFGEGYVAGTDKTFEDEILRLRNDREYYENAKARSGTVAKEYEGQAGAKRLSEVYQSVVQHHSLQVQTKKGA